MSGVAAMHILPNGIRYFPAYLDREKQKALLETIREIVAEAPLFVPEMPRTGKPLSVRMTNCGPLGWVTDRKRGYRYQAEHPVTGKPWPAIPKALSDIWRAVSESDRMPEACLVNFYTADARMGLHQDKDEKDLETAVVSISLGDTCLFRVGGKERSDGTSSIKLASGDIVVLGGEGRLCFHGVDRIYPGTSTLLKKGGVSTSPSAGSRSDQSLRSATVSVRWFWPFCRIRSARGRVGRMFWRRFLRLILCQRPSAIFSASSSLTSE
jgi:DNA oxidative demethylase